MADTSDFFANYLPNKLKENPDLVSDIDAVFVFDIDGAGQPVLARERHHAFPTLTATSVGLVTMSKTAERFCDCAMSARFSSSVAFASMTNVIRIALKPLRTSASMLAPCLLASGDSWSSASF